MLFLNIILSDLCTVAALGASKTHCSKTICFKNAIQNATQYRQACDLLQKINNNSGVSRQMAVTVYSLLKGTQDRRPHKMDTCLGKICDIDLLERNFYKRKTSVRWTKNRYLWSSETKISLEDK